MKLLDSLIVVKNALFDLVMALMGRREEENMDESEVSEILPDKAKKKIKKESKDELPDVSERNQDLPVSEVKDDDVETEPKPSMESVLSLKEVEGEVKEEKVHVDSEVLDGLVQSEDFSKINSDAQEPVTSSESTFHNISKTAELDREGRPEVVSSGHPESAENKLQHDEVTQDHIDSVTSMEARDPAEAQESVQELAVDKGTTPEHEEDLKSKLAGNLVEHEPIGFTTVESVSPAELVNKVSDELPNTVIQEMLSEESNLEVAPAQVLKPCKEDEIHVKEMKMMEAALQGAAQLAQETSARKAEAWAAVERTLQSRLQEAEAKAASADERERSINERLSQTLSRINVLEAQISCLRTEQTQLNRSLEKERQRAAENRQEYLAAKEVADTHEGRVNQLEEEIMELKRKHKSELQELQTVTPSVPPVLKTYFRKNKKGGGNK